MNSLDWKEILEKLSNEPTRLFKEGYELADDIRRTMTFAALLGLAHFVVLIAVHAVLQNGLFSSANSIWGALWIIVSILGLLMLGGWPVFGLLAEASRGDEKAIVVVRILIGFITIETFVNILFAILPFHAAWAMLLFLPSALGCYFLVRIMAGLTINWARWAIVPLVNIVVAVISIIYQGRGDYEQLVPEDASGWVGSHGSFLSHPGIWIIAVFVFVLVRSLKGGSKNVPH